MHILVVEALLIALYSTGDEQILIHKRKPCRSRTCLVRIAGPCPAEVYQPANSNRNAAYSQHSQACATCGRAGFDFLVCPGRHTTWVVCDGVLLAPNGTRSPARLNN